MNWKNLVILFLMAVTMPALAQTKDKKSADRGNGGTVEERANRLTEKMDKALKLDAKQREKLANLNVELVKQREKMREASKEARQDLREEARAAKQKYEQALVDVLTKDQYKSYLKMRDDEAARMRERREARGNGRGHGHDGAPGDGAME